MKGLFFSGWDGTTPILMTTTADEITVRTNNALYGKIQTCYYEPCILCSRAQVSGETTL